MVIMPQGDEMWKIPSRVLEKPEDIKARLRARFQNIPPELSLADELIAERREAAKKEAKE